MNVNYCMKTYEANGITVVSKLNTKKYMFSVVYGMSRKKSLSCTPDREIQCFTWMVKSYITHVISPKGHVLLLNTGCNGRHVT